MQAAQQCSGRRLVDVVYAGPGRRHGRAVGSHQCQTGDQLNHEQPQQATAARQPPTRAAGNNAVADRRDEPPVIGASVEPVAEFPHGRTCLGIFGRARSLIGGTGRRRAFRQWRCWSLVLAQILRTSLQPTTPCSTRLAQSGTPAHPCFAERGWVAPISTSPTRWPSKANAARWQGQT